LGLRLLSGLFGAVVRLRSAAYRRGWRKSERVAKPVVVIGNLVVGGSGKTPLVIWLVEQLRERGWRAGVVLRGYGGREIHEPRLVGTDSDPREVGDEALLLRLRTDAAVVVGADRLRAAQRLLQEGVDLVVADDGLQHLRLRRDFEIAVVDGNRGLGNGYLLPAGPLREPASRLAQVDCVVLNGGGPGAQRLALPSGVPVMMLQGGQLLPLWPQGAPRPLASLSGTRVHAVAGIGHPARFFAHLAQAGLDVIEHPFADHHDYRPEELRFGDGLPVLMTEKDAVKCRHFAAADFWYLPIAATFSAQQASALLDRVQSILRR
jgi:tetraacyldisaccharide 4'-kinase